jgi:gamma-glutamylaminecyclotransferase
MGCVTDRRELFVYGTLMRGEHHHDLMAGAEFVREAETLPAYELVVIDYFPALLEGGQTCVRGELYRVDADMLARLDALEEVPHYYVRARITLADGTPADTYLMPRERAPGAVPVPSGSFRSR